MTPSTETTRELALVRNNEVVHTVNPATKQVEFEHTDQPSLLSGILYYSRPLQTTDEIARSSPVCLSRRATSEGLGCSKGFSTTD